VKKIVLVSSLLILTMLLVACGTDQESAEACSALGEVGGALAEFGGLDDSSTTDEARELGPLLEKAKENMAAAAAILSEGELNGANLNLDALLQGISNMEAGGTIAEAQVDFKWDLITAMAGTLDLFNANCTER